MVLKDITFSPSFEEFSEKIGIGSYKGMEEEILSLFNAASVKIQPKTVYEVCFIDSIEGNAVTVNGVTFTSSLLRKNLDQINRVFCYIATCGTELDDFSGDSGDFLINFLVDEIKDMALNKALEYLRDHIKRKYKVSGISSMNPGSADAHVWPIEQQAALFSLLGDVRSTIGVELTESFLMIPNKTVSGMFFPSEVDFEMCQVCTRRNCPGRRVPRKKH